MSAAGEQPGKNDGGPRKYDLEERTARFGEAIIQFAKKIPSNAVTMPLITQLVRSGTSVGANYCEADDAVSKKEFRNKIGTCKKEARENQVRAPHAGGRTRTRAGGIEDSVEGSKGTPPDLCQDLS